MALQFRKAHAADYPALQQMLELYQYELSDLWPQDADASARYGYDLQRHRADLHHHAHVALQGTQYVGLALVAPARVTREDGRWMEQFFVLKRHRRAGTARALALHVLNAHPGPWEVGQMPGNAAARAFWRDVIAQATGGRYRELEVTTGAWQGTVQQFEMPPAGRTPGIAHAPTERPQPMALSVSPLQPGHIDSLVELMTELHGFYNDPPTASADEVRDHLLRNLLPQKDLTLLVAVDEHNEVQGLAALVLLHSLVEPGAAGRRQCLLKELYVRTKARSLGVGHQLMRESAAFALKAGCGRLDWNVKATNVRGIRFYERLGGQRVEERLSFRLSNDALIDLP